MKTYIKGRWNARAACGLWSPGMAAALAISFMIMFFAPMEIYLNNQGEFWYDAWFLLPWCLLYFGVAFIGMALLFGLLWFLGDRVYDVGLGAAFLALTGCYVQGNFQVKNLPALDGSEFVLADYKSERIASGIIWGVLALLAVGLCIFLKKKAFRKIVGGVSLFLFLLLAVTVLTLFFTAEGYQKKDALTCVKDDQFEMSVDTNFIIFLLDAVDAGKFEEAMERHPEYRENMKDFTYYSNVMGGYPCTDCAVPLLLSGEWYENEEAFEDYVHHVYGEGEFFDELEQLGYGMSIYEEDLQLSESVIGDRYQNLVHTKLKLSDPILFAKRQMKMVGFKYMPWVCKQYCWFDAHQLWNQRAVDVDQEIFMWEDFVFYADLKAQSVTYTDQKQFKLIHLEGAHAPFRYNAAGERVHGSDYVSCIEASFTVFQAYLEKLRESGVYDNTVIAVMSDHGLGADEKVMAGRQHPVLLIKGIGEQHDSLQVLDTPVSHEDYVGAYQRLLSGDASDEVFVQWEGQQRERRYLLYHVTVREHMEEYVQTGHASDESTMQPTGRVFDYNKE
ncbi:MAG: sulfatase-like hydrolase/transferase [Lachnospiraceae bacterium]|nr:sulfatase-like hydrolase/transferase [Lachnospiraceae bacterium]